MDDAVLRIHNEALRNHRKTLYDLSVSDGNPSSIEHALDDNCQAARIEAIDFDSVRKVWFPDNPSSNTPCSVDALYYSDSKVYMIEFKVGKPKNILRKVYDTALMLIEKDGITVPQLLEKYIYIIVSSDISKEELVLARGYEYSSRPWKKPLYDNCIRQWQLKNIDGVVIAKVHVMPPDMFNDFVKAENWT